MTKHSGEKSNKCNQCNYASYKTGTLKIHKKIHSGEKTNKFETRKVVVVVAGVGKETLLRNLEAAAVVRVMRGGDRSS